MSVQTPATSLLSAPIIPAPAVPGQVVGLALQNPTSVALAGRLVSFGQEFAPGQVPKGAGLVAIINGQPTPVQMDVKTTNPDGSVAMAVLTLAQPAIAAGASVPVMLALAAPASTPAKPVDISALAAPGSHYNVQVTLALHNANGTTCPFAINAAAALAAALKSGAYSTWLSGPQATQVRVDVPVSGSLHVALDITAFANGNTSTKVTFNNDIAMSAHGGAATYDATITQNGAVAFNQSGITQYQYTSWNTTVASNGAPAVNVQHDIAALEKTGLIQNYDLTAGVAPSLVASEAAQMAKPGFGAVLGNAGVTQYMPMTGGHRDIGPTTEANALWLMTQNATAAQYALAQANAAGSIPWHFDSPANGEYLTATANPKLWVDYRGGMYGTTALTQPVASSKLTGWTPDPAHQPDLDYVAYLMTGDRTYLDELNAQASYDVLAQSPTTRQGAAGVVADGQGQVRGQAWDLRAIVEAAAVNPAGSAEKAYFTQLETNNFASILKYVQGLNEGQATGWITGSYGNAGQIAPWQQDFFATTVALAAEQGVAGAAQLLGWETNFLAGLFLNAAKGISPYLGAGYNISTYAAKGNSISNALQTWAAISQATLSSGFVAATAATSVASAEYAMEARGALADDITVTQDVRAIQAYGWVSAYETTANLANEQAWPVFDIAPRLSDGQLLTSNNIIVTSDTIARVVQGSATADQLIYETGVGNVTLQGGSGINILFAGSGADTLIGGANNDDLFAGSGTDLLAAGAGHNYMQAGSGADTFLLDARQVASDTIAGFVPGTDKLSVLDASGHTASASEIAGYIKGATADALGNAVLHLSSGHTVTLQGIAKAQLSASWFGGQSALPPAPPVNPPPAPGNTYVVDSRITGQDQLTGFRAGVDQLVVVGANGQALSGTVLAYLVAGMTTDTLGNVVLHPSANLAIELGATPPATASASSAATPLNAPGVAAPTPSVGSSPTTFVESLLTAGADLVQDFQVGVDHLHILGTNGQPLSASTLSGLLRTATADASGSAVLQLSSAHTLTLAGVGLKQLSASMFA